MFFEAIVHVLNTMQADAESIEKAFYLLERCFRASPEDCKMVFELEKGLDTLEILQQHQNDTIYNKSQKLMKEFFDIETDMNEMKHDQ